MEKEKTGCKGYYLFENGKCEILISNTGSIIFGRKPTLRDCKKCTCPSNQYNTGADK